MQSLPLLSIFFLLQAQGWIMRP